MSQQEICWWLKELRRRYGWGTRVLGRTLGLSNEAAVERKANGKEWIYPTEQIRMSRQIKRILSGELVCKPGRAGRPDRYGNGPGKAVIAAHPVPLVPPNKMVLDVEHLLRHGIGRLKLVPAYEPPLPLLPNFEVLRGMLSDG
jgi:hypothetical protein